MTDDTARNDLATEMVRRARDATYVAVGLGVLGVQRVRAARHDLVSQDRVDDGVARLRTGVVTGAHQVGEWLDGTLSLVSSQLAPLGDQLPPPARDLAEKARTRIAEVGAQLRQLAPPGA